MMAGPDGAKHRIGKKKLLMYSHDPIYYDSRAGVGSEAASARQTVFNNHFPETLFAFGVPASCAFPPEPRVIATRALMAFTNIEVLSMADE